MAVHLWTKSYKWMRSFCLIYSSLTVFGMYHICFKRCHSSNIHIHLTRCSFLSDVPLRETVLISRWRYEWKDSTTCWWSRSTTWRKCVVKIIYLSVYYINYYSYSYFKISFNQDIFFYYYAFDDFIYFLKRCFSSWK